MATQLDTGMAIYANKSAEQAEAHAQQLAAQGFQIRGMTLGSDRKVIACADGWAIVETVSLVLWRPREAGDLVIPEGYSLESAGGVPVRDYLERNGAEQFGTEYERWSKSDDDEMRIHDR